MSEMPAALYKYLNPDRTAIVLCRPRTCHTTHPGGWQLRRPNQTPEFLTGSLRAVKSTLRKGLSQRETIPTL
jgi:hypothetical protein